MLKKEDEKEAAECIVRDHGCSRGKEEIHDGQVRLLTVTRRPIIYRGYCVTRYTAVLSLLMENFLSLVRRQEEYICIRYQEVSLS